MCAPSASGSAQVLRRAVGADEDGLLGELRADRARGVEAGRAGGKFELGVVGKDDVHGSGQELITPGEDDRNEELNESPAEPEAACGPATVARTRHSVSVVVTVAWHASCVASVGRSRFSRTREPDRIGA